MSFSKVLFEAMGPNYFCYGELAICRPRFQLFGETCIRAARIEEEAERGRILISSKHTAEHSIGFLVFSSHC